MHVDRDKAAAILREVFAQERIASDAGNAILPACLAIAEWLVRQDAPLVFGISGAQGSGKSTMSLALAAVLERCAERRTVVLSIDDFYLSPGARQNLARTVHPLFVTRGVPGTHDVTLAMRVLDALLTGTGTLIPRFDKATDDLVPRSQWSRFEGKAHIVLLEGWCVGARPQLEVELQVPINSLERDEDRDGIWRTAINDALSGPYRTLFSRIDRLLLIAVPSFNHVLAWRGEQERKLARRIEESGGRSNALMDEATLARFIMHYERLTRHILADMPSYADGILALGPDREVRALRLQ